MTSPRVLGLPAKLQTQATSFLVYGAEVGQPVIAGLVAGQEGSLGKAWVPVPKYQHLALFTAIASVAPSSRTTSCVVAKMQLGFKHCAAVVLAAVAVVCSNKMEGHRSQHTVRYSK
jgi:hypothetical protein